jgi:hypothetical protein
MRFKKIWKSIILSSVGAIIFISGCSHYRITDPATGKAYYTMCYHRTDGAVKFKDKVTDQKITLQSPQITKIDAGEYKSAVKSEKPVR